MLASLLTLRRGEHLFYIGSHPPRAKLFANETIDKGEEFTGARKDVTQINTILQNLSTICHEIGAKVSFLHSQCSSF